MSPTVDIAFKKLFGNEKHTDILISFLNSILERKDGEKITLVVINDPQKLPELSYGKMIIIDVLCTDQAGKKYIVEMQVRDRKDFLERAQFYSAISLSRQLKIKENYEKLTPVIFIGVVDFNLFKDNTDRYVSHHVISDSVAHKQSMNHLEYHFIELSKFNKMVDELSNDADRWIFLLKNADELHAIPKEFEDISVMHDAFGILEEATWSDQERQDYFYMIELERKEYAEHQASIEKGMEKGIEKGMKKGMEKGAQNKAKEIAKELLKKNILPLNSISEITGLSIEEIENL